MVSTISKPQVIYQPFAETGDKNTILDTPDAENPQLANLQTGFPVITQIPVANGGIPPERKDFNGLGYMLSSFYYYIQCGGTYTFEQDVSDAIGGYPNGAVLYYTDGNGVTYRVKSNKADNTDNFVSNPAYIGDSWDVVSDTPQELLTYIGDIKASVRSSNHGNWFLCNGQAISRTTYATLFSIIGTTYGDGDGSTTFNIPDFSNVVLPTETTVGVKGTGKTLGFTNGTYEAGLIGDTSSYNHHMFRKTAIDKNVSTSLSGTSEGAIDGLIGVATDASKSGLTGDITSTTTMNYFIRVL